jgi:hypothetical protein
MVLFMKITHIHTFRKHTAQRSGFGEETAIRVLLKVLALLHQTCYRLGDER